MLGPGASLFGKAEPKLTAEQREVFDLVGRGHETADAVATAAQIPVADRWAIVAYERALQFSQQATIGDVPDDRLADLDRPATAPAGEAPRP